MRQTAFQTSLVLACCLAGAPAVGTQQPAVKKHGWARPTQFPPRLIKLMAAIHQDFLHNKGRWPWLKSYTNQCLTSPDVIYYGPPFTYQPNSKKSAPPRDHMFLSLTSIDNKSAFNYSTAFDKYPICKFPKDGLKLYGNVVDHDPNGEKLRDWAIHTVLDECKKL